MWPFSNVDYSWYNSIFYLETSAVNKMIAKYDFFDLTATKEYQQEKGNTLCISPVVLWEILLSSDDMNKEKIIFGCQHLFSEKMLASPSELILKYIDNGCCNIKPDKIYTESLLGNTWHDVNTDNRRTFIYDKNELKRGVKHINRLSKHIDKIVYNKISDENEELFLIQRVIEHYITLTVHAKDNESIVFAKLVFIFIFYILCIGLDIDNSAVNKYWNDRNINDAVDKLEYLINNYRSLFVEGPFIDMALIAYSQVKKNDHNRGLYFDCMHGIYLPYVDIFITCDSDFNKVKGLDKYKNKIYLFDNLFMSERLRKLKRNPFVK
jgi:hypothetical protein